MVNNEQIRNTRLDVLKVVCCILVIVLHSPQLCGGVVGEFIRALTAVAVPTFMAISGYCFLCTYDNGRILLEPVSL